MTNFPRMQRVWLALAVGAGCALLPALPAQAQVSFPMLMSLHPVAAQAGATTEHEVQARYNLWGASQVLVSGSGVRGEIATPFAPPDDKGVKPNLTAIKIKLTVDADALPGVREFRLVTPQGVSTIGQLVVGRDPVTAEAADNDTLDKAQAVALPATLCGTLEKAEDVDCWRFRAEVGQALTFHVQSMRLQDKIHDLQTHVDPILTLRTAAGATLAQSDNFFFGDPLLHHRFELAGDYVLEIRDVRYQGNIYWKYSIECHGRPFVTNAHPLGVAPGAAAKVRPVGFALPQPMAELGLPADMPEGPAWVGLPMGGGPAVPAPVVVSRLPEALEAEGDNNGFDKAQPVTLPAGISGRIEREADIDCYSFEAKKGERFTFEVVARRRQSSLDSALRVLNDKGAAIAENDDGAFGKLTDQDSRLENWTAPADGRYTLEIRDLHLRGGEAFVYFLRCSVAEPLFELAVDTDKTILAPGLSGPVYVRALRKNGFAAEIQLHVDGLPPGVTAVCGRIPAGAQDGCIVLTATADAPRGAANLVFRGAATIPAAGDQPARELAAIATPLQEIYMPGGGRGHYPVGMHTVSVGDPGDLLSVKLNAQEVVLKPGESQKIEITIERAPGFDKNVTLDMIYRHLGTVYGDSLPKGVTINEKASKTLLGGKESQGYITLVAAADAPPIERQQVAVMAHVSINFVMKMTYGAPALSISVQAP